MDLPISPSPPASAYWVTAAYSSPWMLRQVSEISSMFTPPRRSASTSTLSWSLTATPPRRRRLAGEQRALAGLDRRVEHRVQVERAVEHLAQPRRRELGQGG